MITIGQRLLSYRQDHEKIGIVDFLWENRKHFITNDSLETSDKWGLVIVTEGPYSSAVYTKSIKYKYIKELIMEQGILMEFIKHNGMLRFTISPTIKE